MPKSRSDWIDLDNVNEKFKSTNQFQKLKGHFENKILKKDSFQTAIIKIREDYDIEIQADENPWNFIDQKVVSDREILNACKAVCKKFNLPAEHFADTVYLYVLTNEVKYHFGGSEGQIYVEEGNDEFPAIIKVGPYVNKSDLVDFVDKTFKTQIAPFQKKYASKEAEVGKYRHTNPEIKKRDEFIYSHRELPYAEISDLVADKFGDSPDEGAIGKIISLEKKRRK